MDNIRIKWRAPILMLVIAATAIPIQLRPPGSESVDFGLGFWDALSNVAGYVPVGVVLAELRPARALALASLLSALTELSQFPSLYRTPSATDLVTNVIGAALGIAISRHWHILSPTLKMDRRRALVAAALALILLPAARAWCGPRPNPRGLSAPGVLEAHWTFDESHGSVAHDSSGHGLNGTFQCHPHRVRGILGGAIRLDGKGDCINCGHPGALRLMGSMTLSAWINSSSFPTDDAAIISSLNNIGYQLDTTVDRGPRTIGFKLTDKNGKLMARYGTTPMAPGTWYHVAGVYNAEAQTLDVYLNGKPDNGFLLGTVSPFQVGSREAVFIGRRSVPSGFEFAGIIDDVRFYSAALTQAQIVEVMRGGMVNPVSQSARQPNRRPVFSTPEDARLPGVAGVLGVLVALAWAGFWPASPALIWVLLSSAMGLLVLGATGSNLPALDFWLLPLTSCAGGAAVAVSRIRGSP